MNSYRDKPQMFFKQLLAAIGLGWLWNSMGPLLIEGEVQWYTAIVALITLLCAMSVLSQSIIFLAGVLDWWSARTPTGRSGTAQWAKCRDIKDELLKRPGIIRSFFKDKWSRARPGPIWGRLIGDKAAALIIDYSSVALTVGPSGSGKAYWNKVGSAWKHKDGKGFDVQLESMPVNGRITLRELRDERISAIEQRQSEERAHSKDRDVQMRKGYERTR